MVRGKEGTKLMPEHFENFDRFRDIVTKSKSVQPDLDLMRQLAQQIKNQDRRIPDPSVIPEYVPPPEQTTEEQLAGATVVPEGFLGIRGPELDPDTSRFVTREQGRITGADAGETFSALLPGIGGTLGAAGAGVLTGLVTRSPRAAIAAGRAGFLTGKAGGSYAQQELQKYFPKLFGKPRSSLLSEALFPGFTTKSNATDAFLEDLVFDIPGAAWQLAKQLPDSTAGRLATKASPEEVAGFEALREYEESAAQKGSDLDLMPDTTVGTGNKGGLARNIEDFRYREELAKMRDEGLPKIGRAVEVITDLEGITKKTNQAVAIDARDAVRENLKALRGREKVAFAEMNASLNTDEFFEMATKKTTPATANFADDSFDSAVSFTPSKTTYTKKAKPTIIKGPVDLADVQPMLQEKLEQVYRELGIPSGTVINDAGEEVLARTGQGDITRIVENPELPRLRQLLEELTTPKQKFTGETTPPIEGFIFPHEDIKELRTLLNINVGQRINKVQGRELGLAGMLGEAIEKSFSPGQFELLEKANALTKEITDTLPFALQTTAKDLNLGGKLADPPESIIKKAKTSGTEADRLVDAAGGDVKPLQEAVVRELFGSSGIGKDLDVDAFVRAMDKIEFESELLTKAFGAKKVATLRNVMKFASKHIPPAAGTGTGNTLQFLNNRVAIYGTAASLGAIVSGNVLKAIVTPTVAIGGMIGITFTADKFATKVLMNNHSAHLAKQLIKLPAGAKSATPLLRKLLDLRVLQGLRVTVIVLDKETGKPKELLLDNAVFNSKNNPKPEREDIDYDALLREQGLID